jgi:hypothetical protein
MGGRAARPFDHCCSLTLENIIKGLRGSSLRTHWGITTRVAGAKLFPFRSLGLSDLAR